MKVRIPNSGGPGNMNQMLKQAQKMQADMAALQEDLENREFSATSGGGMVEVIVDGKHLIKSIKINPPIKIWGKTQRKVFENKEDLFKWIKNFPPSQIGYVDKYNIFYPGITPELNQRIENFYNSFTKSLIKIEWD